MMNTVTPPVTVLIIHTRAIGCSNFHFPSFLRVLRASVVRPRSPFFQLLFR